MMQPHYFNLNGAEGSDYQAAQYNVPGGLYTGTNFIFSGYTTGD